MIKKQASEKSFVYFLMKRGKFSVKSTYVGESGDINFISKFDKNGLSDNSSTISRHHYYGDFDLSFCMRDEDVVRHILDFNKIQKIWFDSLENKLIIEGLLEKIEFDGRCVKSLNTFPRISERSSEDLALFEGDIFCSEQYGMNTRDFILGKEYSNNKRRANLSVEQYNSIKNHVSLKFLYEIAKRFCLLDLTFAFEWVEVFECRGVRHHSSSLKLIHHSSMVEEYTEKSEIYFHKNERVNSLIKKYFLITENILHDSPKEIIDWRIMTLCEDKLRDLDQKRRQLNYTFSCINEKMNDLMGEIKTELDQIEIFD